MTDTRDLRAVAERVLACDEMHSHEGTVCSCHVASRDVARAYLAQADRLERLEKVARSCLAAHGAAALHGKMQELEDVLAALDEGEGE